MKKIAIFTDCDLDGLGSFHVFNWYTRFKDVEHEICSQSNFRNTFTRWLKKNNPRDYDKIYIFDLDVSQSNMDLVDHENFTIIDHHETHVKNKDNYKKATTILQEYTSCCKLLYSLLKKKYPDVELNDNQKMLILLVDDYDSYTLKLRDSYNMNVIVWNYVGDRAQQFARDFGNGFTGFRQEHLNMIHLNNKRVKRVLDNLEVFEGQVPINGEKKYICGVTADTCLNEVAHHVLNKYDCDICMVLNMKSKRVSFHKTKKRDIDVDLGALAKKIAEGGGHPYAAGGKITDMVMSITKMLG